MKRDKKRGKGWRQERYEKRKNEVMRRGSNGREGGDEEMEKKGRGEGG